MEYSYPLMYTEDYKTGVIAFNFLNFEELSGCYPISYGMQKVMDEAQNMLFDRISAMIASEQDLPTPTAQENFPQNISQDSNFCTITIHLDNNTAEETENTKKPEA